MIGLLALLVGLIGGALLGRRNRVVSGTAVPLAQGVVAEGTATAGPSVASGGQSTRSCSGDADSVATRRLAIS